VCVGGVNRPSTVVGCEWHWRRVNVIVDVDAHVKSSTSDSVASQLRPSLSVTFTWYAASMPHDPSCRRDTAAPQIYIYDIDYCLFVYFIELDMHT